MKDTPQTPIKNRNKNLPGQIYTLDQQCELIYGSHAKHCNIYLKDEKDCGRLWCLGDTGNCRSSNLPWADGTPCKDDHHWCQKGSCVHKDISVLTPINGGWGPWSQYTPCSRTCGGGVQETHRECNNPTPENGGKYCLGIHRRYKSCNTRECSPQDLDFREQQCFEFNGNNFSIHGIDRNVKWVPKYGVSKRDECKLYCRIENDSTYFVLADKVIDGTTCSFDSYNKCINGICRPAGCDNKLDSTATLDRCGECQGNNDTCDEVTGNIYKSHVDNMREATQSPFHFSIITIPKGSANIEIKQIGSPLSNYIVLLDDQGEYLLNGNNVINSFRKSFAYAGVTFEYSGANSTLERVNTTYSRKIKRDLIVEILSLPDADERNDEMLLTYTYTISKKLSSRGYTPPDYYHSRQNLYEWKMSAWSSCEPLCQGSQHRSPVCMNASEEVSSSYCDHMKPPIQQFRACNMDCKLTNHTITTKCLAACGMMGRREITYKCKISYDSNNTHSLVDNSHCSTPEKDYESCRRTCPEWSTSNWSSCSRSCGSHGIQTRSVICLAYPNGPETDESECSDYKKPETRQICSTEPCPEWAFGEETPCSVTCGIGQRTKVIFCKQNNEIVDKHMCAGYPMLKPIKTNCTMPPCSEQRRYRRPQIVTHTTYQDNNDLGNRIEPIYNSWRASDWGGCNEMCLKNRTVYCQGSRCLESERPKNIEKCCDIKYVAIWTPCSAICGHGIRKRVFVCMKVYKAKQKGDRRTKERIDEKECSHLTKPTPKRPQKSCKKTCKWVPGKWTQCSGNCGMATREVSCKTRRGLTLPNEFCDMKAKPMEKQKCPCKQETKYSNCNCQGFRRVRIPCYKTSNYQCRDTFKREKCRPPRDCTPQSCLQAKRIYQVYSDGEYILLIKRKSVHIYCHDMKSSSPKEFITLPEGGRENFSLYYSKRARDPNVCPTENRDNEFSSINGDYGHTAFEKIRISIPTLQVDVEDYTFARTRDKAQPFGSAGDCYSKTQECPQGYLSINLNGTDFRISPRTEWSTNGDYTKMIFAPEFTEPYKTVKAYCGGYCGTCSISKKTHLLLETH